MTLVQFAIASILLASAAAEDVFYKIEQNAMHHTALIFLIVIGVWFARVLWLCNGDSRQARAYRRSWNEWKRKAIKVSETVKDEIKRSAHHHACVV